MLVVPRQDELAGRRQMEFAEAVSRDFVGLITSSALHAHVTGHAAKARRAAALPGAAEQFRRHRPDVAVVSGCRDAGSRSAPLRGAAMKIGVVRIR